MNVNRAAAVFLAGAITGAGLIFLAAIAAAYEIKNYLTDSNERMFDQALHPDGIQGSEPHDQEAGHTCGGEVFPLNLAAAA